MLAIPSVGNLASQCILRESRDAGLLEEVDEDDIVLVTDLNSELPQKRSGTAAVSIAVALVSCSIALQSFGFLAVLSIVAISGYIAKLATESRLKAFVRKFDELDVTARKANRAMLQREMISFGLGLSSSQALSACRLHLFLYCRENILYATSLAQHLVSNDFMSDERRRLMSNFYTDEMKDLVHSNASVGSPHVTQRGITTLLDLFVLHRSEVLRLVILHLHRSSLSSAMLLLFRVFFICYREVDQLMRQLNALTSTLSRKRSQQRKTRLPLEIVKVNELDEVVMSLEDIINGITRKELTKDGVRTALQRVISMKIFASPVVMKSGEESAGEVELMDHYVTKARIVGDRLAPVVPLCDEVYEVIASHQEGEERDTCTFEDNCTLGKSRELMEELHMALADRAAEFAARERRALAAFYGVSDAGLDRIEKEQETQDSSGNKTPTDDKFYEFPDDRNDSEAESSHPEKIFEEVGARSLPSDLLAALRMRSVTEETIGDLED